MISRGCERLYLQKDGVKTLHIDLCKPLPQHQLDGIRFLHRQYKKKVPGVILNDPSGYGKCLQVTLFIVALKSVLKKPILILSDSVTNWKEHFEKWTECGNELIVGNSSPFTKQLIKVNPVKDGLQFSRRAWSFVVLHDEGSRQELLSLRFNTDYKIWVTKDDLKDNLYSLASIYEWLYPNQKLNVSHFTAKAHNKKDVIEKAVLLDAFLEDFLIRRNDFDTPFEKPECHKRSTDATLLPVKDSKKNKDPTGTKIKKSRRNVVVNDKDEYNSDDSSKGERSDNKSDESINREQLNDNKKNEEEEVQNEWFNNLQFNRAKRPKNKDPTGTKVKRSKRIDEHNRDVSNGNACILQVVNTDSHIGTNELSIGKDNNVITSKQNVIENIVDAPPVSEEINPRSPNNNFANTTPTKKRDIDNDYSKGDIDENSPFLLRYSETPAEDTIQDSIVNVVKERIVIVPDTKEKDSESIFEANTLSLHNNPEVKVISVTIPETECNENFINGLNNESVKEEKSSPVEENINNVSNNKHCSKIDNEVGNNNTNNLDDFDKNLAELEAKALQRLKSSIFDSIF